MTALDLAQKALHLLPSFSIRFLLLLLYKLEEMLGEGAFNRVRLQAVFWVGDGEDIMDSSMVRGDIVPELFTLLVFLLDSSDGGLYTPLEARGPFRGSTVMLILSKGIFRTKSVVKVTDSFINELDMDCLMMELKITIHIISMVYQNCL